MREIINPKREEDACDFDGDNPPTISDILNLLHGSAGSTTSTKK